MPLDAQLFFGALREAGVKGFAGVPCSILTDLILEAEGSEEVDYIPASVEGEAVCAAAGMWLAGGLGAALMQNSGLGNAINPLASLCIPYQVPALVIVSWRGEPGSQDAVHHHPMGEATPGLLESLGIPATILRESTDLEAAVADAVAHLRKERRPSALIVPRGVFAKSGRASGGRVPPAVSNAEGGRAGVPRRFRGGELPSRSEFLAAWLERFPEVAAVSTTGFMSRELAARGLLDRHFPMQGSMGFAAAIALGISRTLPERSLHVLDGDGALIMRMGSLATIGALAPRRLAHIVVDNGTYASTGGQLTVSPWVDFAEVALACGYVGAARCCGREGLGTALDWLADQRGSGPLLLHVSVDERESEGLARPELSPPEIAQVFRDGVGGLSE